MSLKETQEALTFDDIQLIPQYSDIPSRAIIDISTNLSGIKLNKPLIASPMDTVCEAKMAIAIGQLGGMGIVHRFMSSEEQAAEINLVLNCGINVCAAIGVNEEQNNNYKDRLDVLVKETHDRLKMINIDIAHGHCLKMKNALMWIKEHYPKLHIMAGNIATKEGASDLVEWGAHSLRVGIGNGSLCETRITAATGIPQATAINNVFECLDMLGVEIPLIADGGCKYPGDVAKALALGADAVIIGSLFAGTKETPGIILKQGTWPNEVLCKVYRGSASRASKVARGESEKNVEGASQTILYKGKVKRIVDDIGDGIRSAMSYSGARSIKDLHVNAKFIRVTQSGIIEAKAYGLKNSI